MVSPATGFDRPDGRVGRRSRYEEGTGDVPRKVARAMDQVFGVDRHHFGLTAPGVDEPQHLVANGEPGDRRPRLHHRTGEIAPLAGRKGRGPSGIKQSLPDGSFSWIDACPLHLYQHLVRSGYRSRHLHHLQDVNVAVLVESHSQHSE